MSETLEFALIGYALLGSFALGWLIVRLAGLEERVQKHKLTYSYLIGIGVTILGYGLGLGLELGLGIVNGFLASIGCITLLAIIGSWAYGKSKGVQFTTDRAREMPSKKFEYKPEAETEHYPASERMHAPTLPEREHIKQVILEKARMASEEERKQKEREHKQRTEERKQVQQPTQKKELENEIQPLEKQETQAREMEEQQLQKEREEIEQELEKRLKNKPSAVKSQPGKEPERTIEWGKTKTEISVNAKVAPVIERSLESRQIPAEKETETQKETLLKKLREKLNQLNEEKEKKETETKSTEPMEILTPQKPIQLKQTFPEKKEQQKPWDAELNVNEELPELSKEESARAERLRKRKQNTLDELKQEVGIRIERKKSGLEEVTISEDVTQRIGRKLEEEKIKEQQAMPNAPMAEKPRSQGLFGFLKKKEKN